MFRFGEVVSAGRTRFERRYALASEVLPPHLLSRSVPRADAIRNLLGMSARAHGIATMADRADYFRIRAVPAKAALAELVECGEVLPVAVAGWKSAAFLHRDARIPRRISATALFSPFGPVVWNRERAWRMFGFHYRIEIYTPAAKRVFGYYTLPLLIDDDIVGRVDLKSDRQNGVLRVQPAWREADASPAVAERVAPLLRGIADWQGLGEIVVMDRGDLARAVADQLRQPLIEPTR